MLVQYITVLNIETVFNIEKTQNFKVIQRTNYSYSRYRITELFNAFFVLFCILFFFLFILTEKMLFGSFALSREYTLLVFKLLRVNFMKLT
jgi:hypothetical protein